MFLKRKLSSKINNIKKSILLLGPRQSGKSTLIRSFKPELEINLANQAEFVKFLSDPGLLEKRIKNEKVIFIDEVQRIPSLLNTVQYLIDSRGELKFYLTGSSSRKLKRGQANLLPGRVLTYELGSLSVEELEGEFDVMEVLKKGLLPGIYLEEDKELWQKTLRSYAATYLKEEVQAEALTRNLEGFSRFFNVVLSRSGDYMDFTKFSSEASIEKTSAKRYFEILEETLVLSSLEPFTKSHRKRFKQHPKFYLFDVGVLNGTLSNFTVSADRIGNLFEHLVLQAIQSLFKSHDIPHRISVYKTEAGAEVDFILEFEDKVFAIEVKAQKIIQKSDFRGLRSFSEFYKKPHKALIFYMGDEILNFNYGTAYPFKKGMSLLTQSLSSKPEI